MSRVGQWSCGGMAIDDLTEGATVVGVDVWSTGFLQVMRQRQ